MYSRIIIAALAILIALTISVTHSDADRIQSKVESALEAAGDNRAELEAVIRHFEATGDTLMIHAAKYVIGNMEGHSYVTYALIDSSGDTVSWDVQDFSNYDSLLVAFDTLEQQHPGLEFHSEVAAKDLETVTSDFLITNIELAFDAWRTKPWAKDLPYESFLEGVLPYRGSSEPLEPWRQEFLDRYKDLSEKMEDPTDPIEAATLINEDLKSWFGFDQRWYYHPTDQGLSEMKESGYGRCEDMTNLTIYAMRANGIAVTSDYTPYWANSGNNHAWNAVILPDGTSIPFMGCEANPGKYSLNRKAAKVYRKSYATQPENLVFVKGEDLKIPRWLRGKSYTDVTTSYGPTANITVELDSLLPDSIPFAYICVFNDNEWKPIDWGEIRGRSVTFEDMAYEVVYLPALYLNKEIVPVGEAVMVDASGRVVSLEAHLDAPVDVTVSGVMSRAMDKSSETVLGSRLKSGTTYELFYWDSEWKSLGAAVAAHGPLEFLAPSGALFRLVATDSDGDERIFTWADTGQVWW